MRVARGLVNELYVDDLRAKVHRSLSEKAARGRHVAGLSYGYRSEADGKDRKLVIVEDQAKIVREIFERYGAGESCQRIAADLNTRGVPGPRHGTWSVSALYGSPAKGAGVLNNRLYVGERTWNRSQWIKYPDTGKRTRIDRARPEWQTAVAPELRTIDDAAWRAVRRRFDSAKPGHRGGHARTLLGGVLRCGRCGGAMVAIDRYRYGCAARKDRGPAVCSGTTVPRRAADAGIIAAVREELSDTQAMAEVRREAGRIIAAAGIDDRTRAERKASLEREIGRLVDAVAQLGLSPALRARLEAAETQKRELENAMATKLPTVDAAVARYRANLMRLTEALQSDSDRARAALAEILGRLVIDEREDGTYAGLETKPAAMLLAAGSQMGLVAGVRFVNWNRCRIKDVPCGSRISLPAQRVPNERRRKSSVGIDDRLSANPTPCLYIDRVRSGSGRGKDAEVRGLDHWTHVSFLSPQIHESMPRHRLEGSGQVAGLAARDLGQHRNRVRISLADYLQQRAVLIAQNLGHGSHRSKPELRLARSGLVLALGDGDHPCPDLFLWHDANDNCLHCCASL